MMRRRPGIALLIALLTLIALAGAVTMSFFPAREGQRIGERAARLDLLGGAAELGLWIGLQSLTPSLLAGHPGPGVLLERDTVVDAGATGIRVGIVATQLPGGAAWLAARARFPGATEARARHLLLVMQRPTFPVGHAVVARAAPDVSPDFVISGDDEAPTGWSGCDPPGAPGSGVLLSQVNEDYQRFGSDSLPSLLVRATPAAPGAMSGPLLVLPPGGSLGPGTGSGVMIAQGPLHLAGPFDFAGVIIALDSIVAAPGVHIHGLVLAGGNAAPRLQGPGAIRRSDCAVRRAEDALARMVAGQWSWGVSY